MTALYAESFEINHVSLPSKGWGGGTNRSTTTGRFDDDALRLTNAGVQTGRSFANTVTVCVGFAIKASAFSPTTPGIFFRLYDTVTLHIDCRISSAGLISVTRNGTSLGTGTIPITIGAWAYFELKVKIDDTTGTVQTWINGTADLNLTGQDTRNGAAAQVNLFEMVISGVASGATHDFDDFVLLDTNGGSPNNDHIGDVRVEFLLPNGNGNSSQFVGSDANSTDNYLLVDDPEIPDNDTTYVESSTVGNKDTYAYENLTPGTGTVYFVQPIPYARKSDAGTRSIVSVARLSATEVDSAASTLSATYLYYPDIRETKPGGGVWTISDVNSAEFGVKVNA